MRQLLSIDEDQRRRIGAAAREKVLANHTARHRVCELENYVREVMRHV